MKVANAAARVWVTSESQASQIATLLLPIVSHRGCRRFLSHFSERSSNESVRAAALLSSAQVQRAHAMYFPDVPGALPLVWSDAIVSAVLGGLSGPFSILESQEDDRKQVGLVVQQ